TGFLDTGTVNFISHLVGIGGDGLAGLGVEAIFEFEDLTLDLPLVKGQLVFSHEITHTVYYQSVTNPIIPVYGGCLPADQALCPEFAPNPSRRVQIRAGLVPKKCRHAKQIG